MEPSLQPCKVSADDVVFSRATEDQLTAVWTLNAAEWAKPLSVDDHITRERTLSEQPAASDLWATWVLTLKASPEVIVASVETFQREVLVAEHGNLRTEKGYGIASVFTNPKYRGNRMGNLLLEKLQEWLDGEGGGWVSVLYSDIGTVGFLQCSDLPA
jgi:GNAT superfamily N-acetyltransferase